MTVDCFITIRSPATNASHNSGLRGAGLGGTGLARLQQCPCYLQEPGFVPHL